MAARDKLVRIYTGTEVNCITLKGELAKLGIIGMIKNDFHSSISTGYVQGVPSAIDLFIEESKLEVALPMINTFKENNP